MNSARRKRHFGIDPEDVPTKLRQCLIAFSILDSAQPMNSTIKLDSETRLKNRKIRYVSAN
ncbi:MAG TPA: hypothetical protein VG735_16425, partial [Caulobacterales bacterium]|nr:hypothetical protein [Caulobacterales bacterium]